ncbi:MAG: PAS domain-containing protein [Gammaproteobacteria bacterium]|nr:PAS domain-containing protein [Gammaproteobacteria bacterium]NIR61447.1 PAS domain-containing protein [Gammaproteobacteria bacterium]NIR91282.1 PAS domain-containing protein [Gammaproteobacteria bacterium]
MPDDGHTATLLALPQMNPNPVLAAAADGHLTYVNPAAAETAAGLDVTVEALLPVEHEDLVRTCIRDHSIQGAHSAVKGRRMAWVYRARESDPSVYIYGHDLSAFAQDDHQDALAGEGLDRLAIGMLVVNEDLRVRYSNRAAASILGAADGLTLDSDRRLCVRGKHNQSDLKALVKQAMAGEPPRPDHERTLAVPRASRDSPVEVLVTPHADGYGGGVAFVFLADAERPLGNVEKLLVSVHGLTRTEARLAGLMAQGLNPAEAAERMGVGITTVRSHLRQLFRKTGTRRQAELVRRIVAGLAGCLLARDHEARAGGGPGDDDPHQP